MSRPYFLSILFICLPQCQALHPHGVNSAVAGQQGTDDAQLDYGMYYVGYGAELEKCENGKPSRLFDVNKPTLVITHGFTSQNYQVPRDHYFFNYTDPETKQPINPVDAWLDRGWNVLVFDWRQFSDESRVTMAENKIWSTDATGQVRWRRSDGSYTVAGSPNQSIGILFVRAYLAAMQGYRGENVRFMAMSLGAQLVARATDLLYDAAARGKIDWRLVPKRAALLDDYATNKPFGGIWRGQMLRDIVARTRLSRERPNGVIWERTKTSNFMLNGLIGDVNTELSNQIGVTEFRLSFIKSSSPLVQATARHIASELMYLIGITYPVPQACVGGSCRTLTSAAASDAQAAAFMDAGVAYVQSEPMRSLSKGFGAFQLNPSFDILDNEAPQSVDGIVAEETVDPALVKEALGEAQTNNEHAGTQADTSDTPDRSGPDASDGASNRNGDATSAKRTGGR